VGALAVGLTLVASASAATKPGYERFEGCPTPAEAPTVTSCQLSTITGGHFKMGSKTVPITNPITLSGGTNGAGEEFASSPSGGLSESPQPVPGGLIGITGLDWLVNFLNAEQLKLYAVTELAGSPKLTPFAYELPIKVRLVNPALGSKCYVGSNAEPILLKLSVGTTNPPPPNEPITGVQPTFKVGTPKGVGVYSNGTFVDNAFAAPGANGCTLNVLGLLPIPLNGLVNAQAGLPSPAGTNETVQNFNLEIVARKNVYEPL
ncbi:MAG TPA: hypothetical protein VK889_04850, partial [Solirubrobacterales bacterium]|nr:hypothetical protein [Solirubrobacterales bacterium]